MAKRYRQRPSNIIGVENEYASYCFDEACIFLYEALENKQELKFDSGDWSGEETKKPKHFSSMSEFYNSILT